MKNEISEEIRQRLEELKAEYEKREKEGYNGQEECKNESDKICLNCASSSFVIKFKNTNRGIYYCGLKDKIVEWDNRCRKWKKAADAEKR